jgi:predicted flavoprotein YhiN
MISSALTFAALVIGASSNTFQSDVVVYGATSAGVAAAVQAARMGKSVVLVEPGRHVGGLTSGGLGRTDIGNKEAIGGIAREFYRRVHKYYLDADVWDRETRDQYVARAKGFVDTDTMWGFEPHAAEEILRCWLEEAGVALVYKQRLDLKSGVRKEGARIVSITMESGKVYTAKAFIDATY